MSVSLELSLHRLTDEEVVERVLTGQTALFEVIMRRYNQRLYRISQSILQNDGEAEDVMQDAYVRAYEHLSQFAGKGCFFHLAHTNRTPRGSGEKKTQRAHRRT